MFGKKWNTFWKAFDEMMNELPTLTDGNVEVSITNKDVSINGNFKSLKINGFVIRVPDHVMRRKK